MTTCPLCGERDHIGPCYADLREQWKQEGNAIHGSKVYVFDRLFLREMGICGAMVDTIMGGSEWRKNEIHPDEWIKAIP